MANPARAHLWLLPAITALGLAGCKEVRKPRFVVFSAAPAGDTDSTSPGGTGSDEDLAAQMLTGLRNGETNCQLDAVADGEGFFALHALPSNIKAPRKLKLTTETPCGSFTRTAAHDEDGHALVPLIAPPGAGCAMTITASIEPPREFRRLFYVSPTLTAGVA